MESSAMDAVAAQRAGLAERARLPWWFWGLFSLATLGLLATPLISVLTSSVVAQIAVLYPSVLVYLLAERLVRWRRGVRLSTKTLRDFPASRRAGVIFIVVGLVGVVAVLLLARHHDLVLAGVAALVASAIMVAAWVRAQHAMRADIAAGRARA